MSRSQQRRVNRLLKVAGPCPACVERQQQLLDRPRAPERLVKHWDQIKVQREDPSWLQEEAVRLAEEADRIELGPGHRDEFGWVPHPAAADEITRVDDEPRRVVPVAAGSRVSPVLVASRSAVSPSSPT